MSSPQAGTSAASGSFRFIPIVPSPATAAHLPSISTFIRKNTAVDSLQRVRASVPCGSCTVCCTVPMPVLLQPSERERFAAISVLGSELPARSRQYAFPNERYLPRAADDSCALLVDNRCSVYADRPHTCAAYDCRTQIYQNIALCDDAAVLGGIASASYSLFTLPADLPRADVELLFLYRCLRMGEQLQGLDFHEAELRARAALGEGLRRGKPGWQRAWLEGVNAAVVRDLALQEVLVERAAPADRLQVLRDWRLQGTAPTEEEQALLLKKLMALTVVLGYVPGIYG